MHGSVSSSGNISSVRPFVSPL